MNRQRVRKVVERILAGAQPERAARRVAEQLGRTFMAAFFRGETPSRDAIEMLCDLAMEKNAAVSGPAVQVLYRRVVEGLCDDFTARGVNACNEVLLRVHAAMRLHPRGVCMSEILGAMGLASEQAMQERYSRTAGERPLTAAMARGLHKVLIPSRVTIGADIVITSVLIQRLRRRLPEAEMVLLGPDHLSRLFLWPGVRARKLPYRRGGDLFERTLAWCALHELTCEEAAGLPPDAVAVFDPDSRLTQLGLLPLADAGTTFHFKSRAMGEEDASAPALDELANRWLDSILGAGTHARPAVCIDRQIIEAARTFWAPVRAAGSFPVVVNLGVGQDDRKRIPDPFEEELLAALLKIPDTVVLLDSGSSPMGARRAERLLGSLSAFCPTDFFNEEALFGKCAPFRHGVVGFKGSIDAIGALIGGADAFFGYDSCCQHLACVSATPSIIVFAGAPNRRFPMRWRPCRDESLFRVIEVQALQPFSAEERGRLVTEVAAGMERIRSARPRFPRC